MAKIWWRWSDWAAWTYGNFVCWGVSRKTFNVSGVVKGWKGSWGFFCVFCQPGWNLGLYWRNQLCFCGLVSAESLQPCCCWQSGCRTWVHGEDVLEKLQDKPGGSGAVPCGLGQQCCCPHCPCVCHQVMLSAFPLQFPFCWLLKWNSEYFSDYDLNPHFNSRYLWLFSPSLSWILSFRISLNLLQGWLAFVVTSGWYYQQEYI